MSMSEYRTTLASLLFHTAIMRDTSDDPQKVKDANDVIQECLELLPSGAGLDSPWSGSDINAFQEERPGRLVIYCPYHPMDENGFYDSWQYYTLVVRPGWDGLYVKVEEWIDEGEGNTEIWRREENDRTGDYLAELLQDVLSYTVVWSYNRGNHRVKRVFDETDDN